MGPSPSLQAVLLEVMITLHHKSTHSASCSSLFNPTYGNIFFCCLTEVGVSERVCDSPPQQTCSCSACHNRVTSPVYNSSHRTNNGKSWHL